MNDSDMSKASSVLIVLLPWLGQVLIQSSNRDSTCPSPLSAVQAASSPDGPPKQTNRCLKACLIGPFPPSTTLPRSEVPTVRSYPSCTQCGRGIA